MLLCIALYIIAINIAVGTNDTRSPQHFEKFKIEQWRVSTNKNCQKNFDQGMTFLWSYDTVGAMQFFVKAQEEDPTCAMCYWGEAVALGPTINKPGVSIQDMEVARNASVRAMEIVNKELGEIHYSGMFSSLVQTVMDRNPIRIKSSTHRRHVDERYANSLAGLYQEFRSDTVGVLFVEAKMITTSWVYWEEDGVTPNTKAKMAIQVLEKVLENSPRHPAALHLYIHLYESSKFPKIAEAKGELLKDVAPWAPHLQHMPSHIYIHSGRYDDAITANVVASRLPHQVYGLHNLDFLVHILRLQGRSMLATKIAMRMHTAALDAHIISPDTHILERFMVPYLYTLVRFSDWETILKIPSPPTSHIYHRAVWLFARSMAHIHLQADPKEDMQELLLMNSKLTTAKLSYGALQVPEIIDILSFTAQSTLAEKNKQFDKSIDFLKSALKKEQSMRYDEPPQFPYSVRDFLGEAYLASGQYENAKQIFRDNLEIVKNSAWSLYGLQAACSALSDTTCAEIAAGEFKVAWKRADVSIQPSIASIASTESNFSMEDTETTTEGWVYYIFGLLTGSALVGAGFFCRMHVKSIHAKNRQYLELKRIPSAIP